MRYSIFGLRASVLLFLLMLVSSSYALSLATVTISPYAAARAFKVQLKKIKATFPECQTKMVRHGKRNIVLNTADGKAKQRVYLIYNASKATLILNIPPKMQVGASAGWASKIQMGHWSALTTQQGHFALACYYKHNNKVMRVACRDLLYVCELNPTNLQRAAWHNKGGYWLLENGTAAQLKSKLKGLGLL